MQGQFEVTAETGFAPAQARFRLAPSGNFQVQGNIDGGREDKTYGEQREDKIPQRPAPELRYLPRHLHFKDHRLFPESVFQQRIAGNSTGIKDLYRDRLSAQELCPGRLKVRRQGAFRQPAQFQPHFNDAAQPLKFSRIDMPGEDHRSTDRALAAGPQDRPRGYRDRPAR